MPRGMNEHLVQTCIYRCGSRLVRNCPSRPHRNSEYSTVPCYSSHIPGWQAPAVAMEYAESLKDKGGGEARLVQWRDAAGLAKFFKPKKTVERASI